MKNEVCKKKKKEKQKKKGGKVKQEQKNLYSFKVLIV